MADQNTKIHKNQNGDTLTVENGGVLDLKTGAVVKVDGSQLAGLTSQLTTITPADAAGTPDYNISPIISAASGAYGFTNAQEAITVLYVIKNLQVRLAEAEARLESLGLVQAN